MTTGNRLIEAPATAGPGQGLRIDVYNPGDKSLFAVSSTIVSGPTEVVLIDARMARADAQVLGAKIKATGKRLKSDSPATIWTRLKRKLLETPPRPTSPQR